MQLTNCIDMYPSIESISTQHSSNDESLLIRFAHTATYILWFFGRKPLMIWLRNQHTYHLFHSKIVFFRKESNRIRNSMLIQLYYLFLFSFSEPNTQIVGEPDIFVDIGSMLNLSCVVSYTERPPVHVTWIHNGIEVSFRGPRNGVSVSLMKKKINYCLD